MYSLFDNIYVNPLQIFEASTLDATNSSLFCYNEARFCEALYCENYEKKFFSVKVF